ncbi:O-antigen ligase family protein [Leucobacter weissii]|uniref:O-antigen ligase family protein n=1 Tax=Leucobacter weissii TaxID=1983706 RepID=A0A939MGS3_9MICO|nr:O-antigen ligase family protein [Leucobacter weissii]MBO1900614.1 O-antigen ligase family protein [Leucobacter weissii]
MAESRTRLAVSAWATIVFALVLGADEVRAILPPPLFVSLAVVVVAASVLVFVRVRPDRFRWYRLPSPLYWFLAWSALSLLWSATLLPSLIGLVTVLATTAVAVALSYVLTWHELLRTLAAALRILIGLRLAFELWSALFAGGAAADPGDPAPSGFLALLALIVWGIQLRAGLVRPFTGWFWVCVSVVAIVLAGTPMVWAGLVAVLAGLGFAMWGRRIPQHRRVPLYATAAVLFAAVSVVAIVARDALSAMLNGAGRLAGPAEAWDGVWGLVLERPAVGWGWVGAWPEQVAPFDRLQAASGPAVASAHDAWLDVWLQTGLVGLLLFAPLVVLTLFRVWFRAVDPPRRGPGPALPYATSALWPWLAMVALMVQSVADSSILVDGGWLLLVTLAVKTRFDFALPAQGTEPRMLPWRRVPIPRG